MSRRFFRIVGLLASAAQPCLAQSLTIDTPRGVRLEAIASFPAGNGPFAVVILGPGAEYPMNAPVLLEVARQLVERGIAVYRFNWGYVTAEPKAGRASQNLVREVEDMAAVVAKARRDPRVAPDGIFVGGKSLGSMVAWRVLAADATLRGGLLLTPVCSRGRDGANASSAEQNCPGIATERRPLAFISGEQDPLCSAPALYRFAAGAAGPARVSIVSGNHVFEDPSLAGDARAADLQRTVGIVGSLSADFVARNLRMLAGLAGAAPVTPGIAARRITPSPPDSTALAAFADSVARGAFGYVDGILVVRDGKTVFSRTFPRQYAGLYPMSEPPGLFNYHDAAWHPYYQGSTLHTLQSVTKSVTSIVFGIAVLRGDIASIDQPISTFLPSQAAAFADARKKRITIRHLMTMTSGIRWPEGGAYDSAEDLTGKMEKSADWASMVLAQPMEAEPGEVWSYSSGSAALLSAIFLAATRQDIQDYAAKHLFTPLGITQFLWKRSAGGLTDTEGGLYLDLDALARLGQLYLDGGAWRGKRIVGTDWVAASVRSQQPQPVVRRDKKYGYGWLWWTPAPGVLRDPGAFFAWGYGGQYIVVLPATRTVAVMTQWTLDRAAVAPEEFARRVERW